MESMTCPSSCSVALRYLVRWHGDYPRTFPPAPLYDDESLIQRLTINTFEDNQYSAGDPDYVLGLIASISYLNRDCDDNNVPPHGIAIDELEKLWINYGISNAKYYIGEAIKILKSKKILHANDEELIPTYEIIVDLYRRWCKVEYPNIDLILSSMLKNN